MSGLSFDRWAGLVQNGPAGGRRPAASGRLVASGRVSVLRKIGSEVSTAKRRASAGGGLGFTSTVWRGVLEQQYKY